ncbi:hypothetical protein [Legionella maioricensis]|uniref:Uncharacterized protein n=1 Tax=Legionella maioricensis TaxID=2896528 RepID=A0A9X2IBX9_9GAMM|nr:hypothetical protein [Legionella maioricensis]MCL9684696.1 hypothetical protein [Legionella maioricensis]MCL9687724.1 hypothetical protein [Legionella maioricensis]
MGIWKSVTLGVLLSLSINNANALATTIINFPQLVRAVENGDDVKAIIHFDNCDFIEGSLSSQFQGQIRRTLEGATTRFNFTTYLHFKERINDQLKDTVTTSMIVHVEQPLGVGELWTIFGRLSVFDDNTATLHINLFDPHHKNRLGLDWLCNISNGRDDNGLVLFDFP